MGLDLKQAQSKTASIKPKESSGGWLDFLNRDIKLFSGKLSDKQKEALYLELSILVAAGVDIRASFEMIESQQTKAKTKLLVQDLKDRIVKGEALSDAFRSSDQFTPYEYFSLQIGEETGQLTKVLKQLADFFNHKLKQRRQFIGALSYPIVILFTSVGAVTFMLSFIVPMFSDIFARFGGDLPYITTLIIKFSDFVGKYFWMFLIVIGLLVGCFWLNRNQTWFKKYSAIAMLKAPLMGPIFRSVYLARLSNSLALLIGARVPLLRSVQLIKQMIAFYPINTSLSEVEEDILNGESLHSSLSKFKIYDQRMLALVKVGEEVNQLDTFFEKLANNYTDEVEHRTGLLNTFLEPAMIIFLGLIVGFILVAMYLPMFELSTSIGGG